MERNALHWAANNGCITTIQYLAPKMQSLLHSTDNLGFTMLHFAARKGRAEMVQLLINDYNLDPTARTKVCALTCRHLVNSSRASGGLCHACGRCACGRDECEVEEKLRQVR